MNRLFSKLHISSLLQSNAIFSRDFASATLITQRKTKLPKPTPNPFALYIKSQKKTSSTQQFVDIAKEWKSSSDEKKKKFKDEAAKLREDAISQFQKLSKKEQQKQFDDDCRHRRAYREFRRETKCPKRPLNAFLLYRQEIATSKQDFIESAKEAGEAYKNLSEDEKKPYFDKSKQQCEAYKFDYEKWYKVHGEDYKKLKKEHVKTRGKKSMVLMNRLKKRRTKRNVIQAGFFFSIYSFFVKFVKKYTPIKF